MQMIQIQESKKCHSNCTDEESDTMYLTPKWRPASSPSSATSDRDLSNNLIAARDILINSDEFNSELFINDNEDIDEYSQNFNEFDERIDSQEEISSQSQDNITQIIEIDQKCDKLSKLIEDNFLNLPKRSNTFIVQTTSSGTSICPTKMKADEKSLENLDIENKKMEKNQKHLKKSKPPNRSNISRKLKYGNNINSAKKKSNELIDKSNQITLNPVNKKEICKSSSTSVTKAMIRSSKIPLRDIRMPCGDTLKTATIQKHLTDRLDVNLSKIPSVKLKTEISKKSTRSVSGKTKFSTEPSHSMASNLKSTDNTFDAPTSQMSVLKKDSVSNVTDIADSNNANKASVNKLIKNKFLDSPKKLSSITDPVQTKINEPYKRKSINLNKNDANRFVSNISSNRLNNKKEISRNKESNVLDGKNENSLNYSSKTNSLRSLSLSTNKSRLSGIVKNDNQSNSTDNVKNRKELQRVRREIVTPRTFIKHDLNSSYQKTSRISPITFQKTTINVRDPKINVSDPKANDYDPKINVSDPKANVCDPKENVCDPKENICDPEENVCDPKGNICDPKANVCDPKPNKKFQDYSPAFSQSGEVSQIQITPDESDMTSSNELIHQFFLLKIHEADDKNIKNEKLDKPSVQAQPNQIDKNFKKSINKPVIDTSAPPRSSKSLKIRRSVTNKFPSKLKEFYKQSLNQNKDDNETKAVLNDNEKHPLINAESIIIDKPHEEGAMGDHEEEALNLWRNSGIMESALQLQAKAETWSNSLMQLDSEINGLKDDFSYLKEILKIQ